MTMQLNKVHNRDWMTNGLPDKSVQLIIADPPYFEVKGKFDFIWPSFDAYLQDVERWAQECKRVLADNGTLFWWGNSKKIAYTQIILDKLFHLENSLVWRKKDSIQFQYYSPDLARTFNTHNERILMYSNETDGMNLAELNYSYQIGIKHTQIMEPLVFYMINEMQAAGFTCKKINDALNTRMASHWFARTSQWQLPTLEWYNKLRDLFNGKNLRREYEDLRREYEDLRREYEDLRRFFYNPNKYEEVLEFSQEAHITKEFNHETKKPEKLTRALILTCSRPNDLVLVPFAGSGTECAMAARENRRFIGFDVERKYCDMANARAQREMMQPKLL